MTHFLPINLQFFATDENQNANTNESNKEDTSNKKDEDNNSTDESQNTDKTIPYARFKEVNDNYKSVKQQLDELVNKQKQTEIDAQKQQGKYQELYENTLKDYEPAKQQLQQYQETFKELLKVKLETVPEEYKDLIPSGSEFEQLKWIENAQSKGLFKTETVTNFGNKGNNPEHKDVDYEKLNPTQLMSLGFNKTKN